MAGHFARAEEQALLRYMRDVPWFDRDRHSLSAAVYATCGTSRCARIMQAFDLMYRDIKHEDAMSLVSRLQSQHARSKGAGTLDVWEFVHAPSGVRKDWRWRYKDRGDNVVRESSRFDLFVNCLADARDHGFDFTLSTFQVIKE